MSESVIQTEGRKLGLMKFVLGSPCILEIDQSEADALAVAMDVLTEMVSAEQKFAILMENFVELEQELASRAITDAYRDNRTAQDFFDDKQTFNRRVMNVLTAVRLYTDQARSHVKAIFPDVPQRWADLNASFSREYDAHLSYRVMEALRNFAQHRGLPVQSLTMGARWLDRGTDAQRLEFNVAISIVVSDLEADPDFKKSVLKELKDANPEGGEFDIKPFLRQYVQSLAAVHEDLRVMAAERVDAAIGLVQGWRARFAEACPNDKPHYLYVGWQNPNMTRERITLLNQDTIEQLETFRGRLKNTKNIAKRFVTTEPLTR